MASALWLIGSCGMVRIWQLFYGNERICARNLLGVWTDSTRIQIQSVTFKGQRWGEDLSSKEKQLISCLAHHQSARDFLDSIYHISWSMEKFSSERKPGIWSQKQTFLRLFLNTCLVANWVNFNIMTKLFHEETSFEALALRAEKIFYLSQYCDNHLVLIH